MDPASKSFNKSHTLPIIDISPYLEGHDPHGRVTTSAALHAACLDYGFFYLDISNYVDPSEPEELIRLARLFFDLPQDEKDNIALKKEDHARGKFDSFAEHVQPANWYTVKDMQGSRKMSRMARPITTKELTSIVLLRILTRPNHFGGKTNGQAFQVSEKSMKSGLTKWRL